MKVFVEKEDIEMGFMEQHCSENPVNGEIHFEGYRAAGIRGATYYVCPTNRYWVHRACKDGTVYEVRNKNWKKVGKIDADDIEEV